MKKPDVLTNDADAEHLSAHKHYITDGKTKAFEHKLFKDLEVKKALENLFNKKCAYCESKIAKTSPIDKEHFRPKTKVNFKDSDKIRGYYWLAADWDNLLAACAFCNRTGTHNTELEEKFVAGKLDFFPLIDESMRVTYGNVLIEEEKVRLLINPCIDKPEKIIAYNEDGHIFPNKDISEKEVKMVKASVETFGLLRSELHKDRRETWRQVTVQLIRIRKAFKKHLQYPNDLEFLETLNEELDELKTQRKIDKEHLGVVRFVIRQELVELRNIIKALNTK
ncbi:hypothetical protein [Olleya sp. 1-3]|uniref:hypothetical protein n=1 Tax=Olleya sp. 1-3 TaxID=2058323 RepID=UPI0012FF169E|nr:hypothetical protein [Olleya sp. 1-3]